MGRLFLRVFLTFAGGTAMIAVVLVLLTVWANQVGLEQRLRGPQGLLEAASDALAQGGEAGLARWLRGIERPQERPSLLIITSDRRELLGRPVPRAWQRWIRRERGGPPRDNLRGPRLLPRLVGNDGRQYTLIWLPRRLGPLPGLPFAWLAAALGVLALVSWTLARSVAKPVQSVQQAMGDLAQGNLGARVGTSLASRKDELGSLAQDFDAMAARLQALVNERDTLLRDVSHELRSPLARQRVALGLAERRAGPELASDLQRIGLEADRLDELIGEILTLSRLRSAAAPSDRINLTELVEDVVNDARFEAPNRDIRLSPTQSAATVLGDHEQLRSAIENVVRNALAYSPEGKQIDVELRQRQGVVTVAVLDRGPGIAPAALADIFKPFYRASPSRDRDSGGEGIGLAITAEVVRLHSGTVHASNREGGGLAVTLELPTTGR